MRSDLRCPLSGRPVRSRRDYTWAELAERADVTIATLFHWVLCGYFQPAGAEAVGGGPVPVSISAPAPAPAPAPVRVTAFAAVDVVRLEALSRLVRSGVPLARAAALVRARR